MASPIDAFKARTRPREITLPSGLVVTYGMIDYIDLLSGGELLIPTAPEASSNGGGVASRTLADTLRYYSRAVAMGAIDPPFSYRPEDKGRTDLLHVNDIDATDCMALGQAILDLCGLGRGAAAQVESFRPDQERPDRASAGGEVSQVTP